MSNTFTNQAAKNEFDINTVANFLVVLGTSRFEVVMTECEWAERVYHVHSDINGVKQNDSFDNREAAFAEYNASLAVAVEMVRDAMKFI